MRKGTSYIIVLPPASRRRIIHSLGRTARAPQACYCCHVLNRGNDRQTVLHIDGDFLAFVNLLRDAANAFP